MANLSNPPMVVVDSMEAEAFITRAGEASVGNDDQPATTALIQIDRARQALELATKLGDVKGLRDQAEALRLYAKQSQQSLEMQNHCAEIKLRAERKAGQMLRDQDKNKGAAASTDQDRALPRLEDLGISYAQSSRWQALAYIPEDAFEERLHKTKAASQEITSATFLRLAEKYRPVEVKATVISEDAKDQMAFGFYEAQSGDAQGQESAPHREEPVGSGSKETVQSEQVFEEPAQALPTHTNAQDQTQLDLGFAAIWDKNREIRLTAEKLRQELITARNTRWRVISRDEALALILAIQAVMGADE